MRSYSIEYAISANTLIDLLLSLENQKKTAEVQSVTAPRLNVKGRSSKLTIEERFGVSASSIRKISVFMCHLNRGYENSVKYHLRTEGKSVTEYERGESWHTPYHGSCIIHQHKDTHEVYLVVYPVVEGEKGYVEPMSFFISGDRILDKKDLAEYLPVSHEPKNQGLDTPVVVRTLKFSSVRMIGIDDSKYNIVS